MVWTRPPTRIERRCEMRREERDEGIETRDEGEGGEKAYQSVILCVYSTHTHKHAGFRCSNIPLFRPLLFPFPLTLPLPRLDSPHSPIPPIPQACPSRVPAGSLVDPRQRPSHPRPCPCGHGKEWTLRRRVRRQHPRPPLAPRTVRYMIYYNS